MKLLFKVSVAYVMASLAAIVTGFVASKIWQAMVIDEVSPWLFISITWLVIVGVPSLFAASTYLLRLLGAKDWPIISLGAVHRPIPITAGNHLTQTVPNVLTKQTIGPARVQTVDVPDLEIIIGDYVISEPVLRRILTQAWRLQTQKKNGLSRRMWVDKYKLLERAEYDALILFLESYGIYVGRRPRKAGKLVMAPEKALTLLREEALSG